MRGGRSASVRAYRLLLLLYPAAFRRQYDADLVQAFRDELRDRGAIRGWRRVLADLVVSVGNENLEAIMTRHTSCGARARFVVGAAAVLALFVFGGVFSAAALVVAAAITVTYWRGRIPYREAVRDSGSSWWRYVVIGAALLGTLVIATRYGPDFEWFPWHLLVFLVLLGWLLVGVGAVLALVAVAQRIRRRIAGAS